VAISAALPLEAAVLPVASYQSFSALGGSADLELWKGVGLWG